MIAVCLIEFVEELQGKVHAIDLLCLVWIEQETIGYEVLIERLVGEVVSVASTCEQGALLELVGINDDVIVRW